MHYLKHFDYNKTFVVGFIDVNLKTVLLLITIKSAIKLKKCTMNDLKDYVYRTVFIYV